MEFIIWSTTGAGFGCVTGLLRLLFEKLWSFERVMRQHRVGKSRVEMSFLIPFVAVHQLAVCILPIGISFMVQQWCVSQSEWTRWNVKHVYRWLNTFVIGVDAIQCILKLQQKSWFVFVIVVLCGKRRLKRHVLLCILIAFDLASLPQTHLKHSSEAVGLQQ